MNPNRVRDFYNKYTDTFIKYYGNVLQTYSSKNKNEYLKYLLKSIGINNNMNILDIGSGVCGPSIYFAKKKKVYIDCLNISEYQVQLSKANITANKLNEQIRIFQMNFEEIDKILLREKYDLIYFIESLGHSIKYIEVINEISSLIKKDGILYIKDQFYINDLIRINNNSYIKEIESIFNYQPIFLHKLIQTLYESNFKIEFIKELNLNTDIKALDGFLSELNFKDDKIITAQWLEIKAIKL